MQSQLCFWEPGQEPCSSIDWHLLVFSIETSRIQIPTPQLLNYQKYICEPDTALAFWKEIIPMNFN